MCKLAPVEGDEGFAPAGEGDLGVGALLPVGDVAGTGHILPGHHVADRTPAMLAHLRHGTTQ